MKTLAIRQIAFGPLVSALCGLTFAGLAQFVSAHYLLTPFAWPLMLYIAAGVPLGLGLDLIPGFETLQWRLFPTGGPAAPFFLVLVSAFVTWAAVFSVVRSLWLRKRRAAPNNSFKPKPLRGSA